MIIAARCITMISFDLFAMKYEYDDIYTTRVVSRSVRIDHPCRGYLSCPTRFLPSFWNGLAFRPAHWIYVFGLLEQMPINYRTANSSTILEAAPKHTYEGVVDYVERAIDNQVVHAPPFVAAL